MSREDSRADRRVRLDEHRAEIRRLKAMRDAIRPRKQVDAEAGGGAVLRRAASRTSLGRVRSAQKTLADLGARRRAAGVAIVDLIADVATPAVLETALTSMTCAQVARRLGVTVRSVRAWIIRGVLKAERRGRAWHIDPASIARLERVAQGED